MSSQSGGIVTGVLNAGDLISSANTTSSGSTLGAAGTPDRYFGFRSGNNYGWLRFSGSANDDVITIHDAAIEDTSGNFIEAGSLVSYVPATVPEPSSSLLLAISTGALLSRRRRARQ